MARILSRGRSFLLGALVTALTVTAQETPSWNGRLKDGIGAISAGQYEVAVQILTPLLEASKAFPAGDLRRANCALSLATAYQQQGRLELAEPMYQLARSILEQAAGPQARRSLGIALHGLGELRSVMGQWNEAEQLLGSAQAACREAGGENEPCALASMVHLGQLYALENRNQDAETTLTQAIEVLRRAAFPPADLLADALRTLGGVYRQQGRYTQTEPLFREALELSRRLGETHPLVADRLVDLGGLYTLEHDTARGEPLLAKAVRIYETNQDPHLADALSELGSVALEEGNYAIAKEDFERSLAMYQKSFGTNHVLIAQSEAGLAQAYLGEKNYKQADSLIRRAIAIGKACLGDAHYSVARLLMVAGKVQERAHHSSEADAYYRQALAIYRHSLPDDHPDRTEAEREYAHFAKSFRK